VPLPFGPPLAPMLAKLARELPLGPGWRYEPKWDGFRCLAFRDGDDVELRSRNDRSLARYFPEVVETLRGLPAPAVVLDGELVPAGPAAGDFPALMLRLHPAASRVARLRVEAPVCFVAFDLLALDDEDLRGAPFDERRTALEGCVAASDVRLTPSTDDPVAASEWLRAEHPGLDGVVAKRHDLAYRPGARAMVKVKRERTADCVVAGVRLKADRPAVSSLLLGLYDTGDRLVHVGAASAFTEARRRALVDELAPYVTPLEGHPWAAGFALEGGPTGRLLGSAARWTPDLPLDWVPLRPELVCEVGHDQVDAGRLRHAARFRRWRPDRNAASCRLEQLLPPAP
jgi:ATP-dependent DNA ligase